MLPHTLLIYYKCVYNEFLFEAILCDIDFVHGQILTKLMVILSVAS